MVDNNRWKHRLSLLANKCSLPFSVSCTSYAPVVPRVRERDEHSGKLADRIDCERAARLGVTPLFGGLTAYRLLVV